MVTKPDRRVRRTQQALQRALLQLMAEKGYESVTIQDIIDSADVGRSTFYNHYSNKDELLKDGFADLRSLIGQPAPNATAAANRDPLRFSLPFLRHIHEQRNLARAIFTQSGLRSVLRHIEELLADVVRDELPSTTPGGVPREAVVRFIVSSHLACLEWWLAESPQSTPEEIDEIFRTLSRPGIEAAGR
ncbi:TetR/AcrR family transcriptional regulator [Actinoallomurus spadix]|nr:TetR/AcrR family transcriptional regulator [Actinoallomurus spadix]MCO5990096.1 TetR/AcrR family transcriptional regulator [Actinoallomurus spadix]